MYGATRFLKSLEKSNIEHSFPIGAIVPIPGNVKSPVAWNDNPDDYFPYLCITNINTSIDINIANWPKLVPNYNNTKVIFNEGLSGELNALEVTNYSVTSNVVTLTFANNANTISVLADLAEDQVMHGSFSNWRTITLVTAIGPISIGTYSITGISAGSRTITFNFTTGNTSGAGSWFTEFYGYRTGNSNTTRIYSGRGLSLHGANDANGYFVSGGLRRRGYLQGHYTKLRLSNNLYQSGNGLSVVSGGGGAAGIDANTARAPLASMLAEEPVSDGTNGTPRTAAETHGPAITTHLYIFGGEYLL